MHATLSTRRRPPSPPALTATGPTALRWGALAVALLLVSGCHRAHREWARLTWPADFETAERKQAQQDRDVLIAYQAADPQVKGDVLKVLTDEQLRGRLDDYITCLLYDSYEPSRRYVEQFGVWRAPAVVVLRTDGTYHAHCGPLTPADVEALLAAAQEPGQLPQRNDLIHRVADYDWHHSLDAALDAATPGQPVLIARVRARSPWIARQLEQMLATHEVHTRCAGWVHCWLTDYRPWGGWSRFGVEQLPALVVIDAAGGAHTLEQPTGADQIARFLDQSVAEVAEPTEPAP